MRNSFCTATTDKRPGARRRRGVALLLALYLLAGCTDLVFYPMRKQMLAPADLDLTAQDIHLTAADGTRLFAWQLETAKKSRGVVCYFHGNAENISTHIVNVSWLPAAGYEVLLVDYRGYGGSEGKADFPEVFADVRAGLDWCLARGHEKNLPVYALGQSLGSALLLDVAMRSPYREKLTGVVADSGFANYRRIARDAMKNSWLLSPLRYPLSGLLTAGHAPEEAVREKGELPLLVMHSPDDEIVPYAHGEQVYAAAAGRKCFLRTDGPHNAALNPRYPRSAAWQRALLDFFAAAAPSSTAFSCPVVSPASAVTSGASP